MAFGMPVGCTMQPVFDAVVDASALDPHEVSDEAIFDNLGVLLEARRRLDATLVRTLQVAHHRGVTTEIAGRTTKWWLVADQRLSGTDAARLVKLACALPAHPALADALATLAETAATAAI